MPFPSIPNTLTWSISKPPSANTCTDVSYSGSEAVRSGVRARSTVVRELVFLKSGASTYGRGRGWDGDTRVGGSRVGGIDGGEDRGESGGRGKMEGKR